MPVRCRSLRLVIVVALALGIAPLAVAADAPTTEEWTPVVTAIAEQAPTAGTQLTAITTRYPKWVGGWIELARFDLAAQQPEDAWKHARQALTLQRNNGEAAALAVQALTKTGRHDHALTVAEPFRVNRQDDKQSGGRAGWVNFYAAQAALTAAQPDLAKADELLKIAKSCAGGAVPGEFHFLEAKLMIRRDDLAGGAKSLERAVATEPRLWDAWYELGRVRSALGEREPSVPGQRQLLLAAEQAFTTVTKALPEDFESWLGLGRAQARIARLEIDAGGEGGAKLKDAATSFSEALQRKPDLVPALTALGEAQLRLERFAAAAESLGKARELGANDEILLSNLALALEKSGRAKEAVQIQAGATATTGPGLVNKGMTLFKAKVYRTAVEIFEQAARHPDLEAQRETRGQVLRFAGHAWRDWAAEPPQGSAPAPNFDEREQRQASAADAYRRAGDLGDWTAIRHYAALEAQRGPKPAYDAGWKLLGWTNSTSLTGWSLIIGNYGASRAWDNLLHLIVWGILAGIPFLLWIASLFRRAPVQVEEVRRSTKRRIATDHALRNTRPAKPEPEMNPLTAKRMRAREALEPRAATPTPRPTPPPPAKHIETSVAPKRPRSRAAGKTPLPETEELDRPAAAPAKRPRPH